MRGRNGGGTLEGRAGAGDGAGERWHAEWDRGGGGGYQGERVG